METFDIFLLEKSHVYCRYWALSLKFFSFGKKSSARSSNKNVHDQKNTLITNARKKILFMAFSDLKQIWLGLQSKYFRQGYKKCFLCGRTDNLEEKEKTFYEKKIVIFLRWWATSFQPFNKKSSTGSSKVGFSCPVAHLVAKKIFSPKEGVNHLFRTLSETFPGPWQKTLSGVIETECYVSSGNYW